MSFQKKLLEWFEENRRPFPWRENTNPYNVWLSEIILQQTRAAQGLPYYKRFISAFPTLADLARASEDEIMKLWQGLGYYSRARNLHHTAKQITEQYNGKFPKDFTTIKNLKGIGDYTASAISSICFNEEQAVVDGNVFRVVSRIYGIDKPVDSSGAHKLFKQKAQILMKGAHPGNFNQAIMEFGAVKCVPKKPNCQDCIFSSNCIAFQEGKVSLFPVKSKKVKVKDRYLHYFVILDESRNTLIEKRKGKGIWQNLYQFPMIETQKKQEYFDEIEIKSLMLKYKIRADFDITKWNDQPIFHKLTHQHLEINFWIVKLCKKVNLGTQIGLIHNYPMPRVLQKFRDKFFIN